MDDPNLEILVPVSKALGDLCESLVFVGGCAVGLLITTQRAQSIRATDDVDAVVHALTAADFHNVERKVESKGFKYDISVDAPICRWIWNNIKLDIMPSESGILSFHNRWYPLVISTANRYEVPGILSIQLISAPVFVATKFEAFNGRGKGDFLASHDLEDLISVIDGRNELLDEIKQADLELQKYLSEQMSDLLKEPDFQMALPGYLPTDSASQSRLPELMRKIRLIAGFIK